MFEEEYPGACISCGFASLRDLKGGELVELNGNMRVTGRFARHGRAECFVGVIDFRKEIEGQLQSNREEGPIFEPTFDGDSDANQAAREVLQAGRHCPAWYPYVPNLSPKEHHADRRMLEVEKMRAEHAAALATIEQRNAELALQLAEEQAKVAGEHASTAEALLQLSQTTSASTDRFNRWMGVLTLTSLVLAVSAVASAIVIPNGISGLSLSGPRDNQRLEVVIVTPTATATATAITTQTPAVVTPTP